MGKKKQNAEYNDFLDGEKLRDNNEVRTSLQGSASTNRATTPPPVRQTQKGSKKHETGKGGPKKPPLTHFLCLPLVTETNRSQLQLGIEKLKEDLEKELSVPPKAVRPVGTLHLTLGVMSLSESELEEAKRFLQEMNLHSLLRDISQQQIAERAAEDGTISENLNAATIPDSGSLNINLEALVPMQAPQKTSILYASPEDPTHRLYPFASHLRNQFTQQGFMLPDARPLKLHATLVNTIYAKPKSTRGRGARVKQTLQHIEHTISPHHHQDSNTNTTTTTNNTTTSDSETDTTTNTKQDSHGHGPNASSWLRFDARVLLEQYKDHTWAAGVRIDKVQICKMGAKKIWSGEREGEGELLDERYEVVCEKEIWS